MCLPHHLGKGARPPLPVQSLVLGQFFHLPLATNTLRVSASLMPDWFEWGPVSTGM
ncbi:hypothetical protein hamaS1_00410 [Moorella sp. Hama-1]|nr:hypothetical protein hamaS1_00410 [Moorella sp. Hama-1]